MKIHRFFLNTGFIMGEMRVSDAEIVHQIRDVLKLRVGETCIFFNATQQEAFVTIGAYSNNEIEIIVDKIAKKEESPQKIFLYCAMLKRENFEWVVQKATELGATDIIPLITQRTVKTGFKRARLEKIATEASEQSEHILVPIIHEPVQFIDALHQAQDHDLTIILHTQEKNAQEIEKHAYKSLGLFVGPEGGFTDDEIEQAKEYNYRIHMFPNTILRAETAAVVGTFWIRELITDNK